MIGVMTVLRDVAQEKTEYAFVDEARRESAENAVAKGVDCILRCQIKAADKKTVWCQQHDENTFAPVSARAFEPACFSASESVGIVRFLMGEQPTPAIVAAVNSATNWLAARNLTGIRVEEKPAPNTASGTDKAVIRDSAASPLWARFYQIGTNRPIFIGRDSIIKYNLADIEHERRVGYAWYGNWAAKLLNEEYPAWKQRLAQR